MMSDEMIGYEDMTDRALAAAYGAALIEACVGIPTDHEGILREIEARLADGETVEAWVARYTPRARGAS